MVKFSRELEAQLIHEWKEAFVNYRQLKKHVKKIKLSRHQSPPPSTGGNDGSSRAANFLFSVLDTLPILAAHFPGNKPAKGDEVALYETELVQSREQEILEFNEKLEEELEKVSGFYRNREAEFCERRELLNKQLQILLDLKQILLEHHRRRQPSSANGYNDALFSPACSDSSISESVAEEMSPAVAEEVITVLERNGVSLVGVPKAKAKKGGKPRMASLRIDIPATTPTRTIAAITSVICEDLINGRKDGYGGDFVTRKKISCAEKMIRSALVELYKGLGLLKTYSSLNMVAFRKILKKFDKVSNQRSSEQYLMKVKRSHFMSSDKVMELQEEVESIFMKHFAGNDRKKAMKFLKPQQTKDSHIITFFVGLFTGSFVALFSIYAILAHIFGIFSSTTDSGYIETIYPIFSMFALLSLHIFLYGCNIFMWRSTRINHNFIFEFSPHTALKYRDAFLICTSFMTTVVGAMVIHLILRSSGVSLKHVEFIPVVLLLLFTGVLICPFNVFYRSTRYSFLRVMRNIFCSPFYKVLVLITDFFMADQLTSQVPLLRHMETTACYFMAGGFDARPYETCTSSHRYKLLAYVISFLPYYWRAMQCIRRYFEEGYDSNHLANAGKYVSAMLAAAARYKYAVDHSPVWLATVIISSTVATGYQLYWDFVKDWGLLNRNCRNPWLRDELVLKNKSIYYVSIALNFILRLAWIETVLQLNLHQVEHHLVDFLLSSLEIIRRGHWNFYRLENEHLNNVGKFRAVKTVPLPFREMDSDG